VGTVGLDILRPPKPAPPPAPAPAPVAAASALTNAAYGELPPPLAGLARPCPEPAPARAVPALLLPPLRFEGDPTPPPPVVVLVIAAMTVVNPASRCNSARPCVGIA
jgi:hypothetical protein